MDYSNIFTSMQAEVTLIAVIVLLFLYDLIAGERGRRRFSAVACGLLALQVAVNVVPGTPGEVFGGMFQYVPMHSIVKSVLTVGTLIVFLQADAWLRRGDTAHKQGEFYILTLSTLLGMYLMVGAGNFLLFFIGMELASVPMACLVAFDKYKRYSAEAGAKYILCALFASGLMLYGISFFYGTTGTLYFDDMAARITGSPLQIMAMVFFFAGLGFKISLVPFHLWTADTYQGAPTTVTSYLSVVSKGSAAFVLMTVLMKVFGPMIGQWQTLLYAVTVLSITVANLFAIRQKDLKRFLAFSSISQAGYIMLAVNNWDKEYQRVFLGGLTCDSEDFYNSECHTSAIFLPKLEKGNTQYIGFFHTGAYQESLGGFGGIQHCLIPAPKHIIIDRDKGDNEYYTRLFAKEQSYRAMMRILGY